MSVALKKERFKLELISRQNAMMMCNFRMLDIYAVDFFSQFVNSVVNLKNVPMLEDLWTWLYFPYPTLFEKSLIPIHQNSMPRYVKYLCLSTPHLALFEYLDKMTNE